MAKFISADEAVELIKSGDTVALSGFIVEWDTPEEVSMAIEKQFLETGQPRDLILTLAASQNDGKSNWGLNRWGKDGLFRRVISAHWGLQPDLIKLAVREPHRSLLFPQGPILHIYRRLRARNRASSPMSA